MKHDNAIGFMIKTLHGMIMRREAKNMKTMGAGDLNYSTAWIIGYLYHNKEREIFQKDIESQFSIARSTVTNMVKQLEKNGYLTRSGVERDSRLKCLNLTPKGEACHEMIRENFRRVDQQMSEGIAPEDLRIFFKVCHQIRGNLSEHSGIKTCCESFE